MNEGIVYVVDDDAAMRESLEWLLSPLGLEVLTYATAQEFLERHRQVSRCCLVADVRMPGMSGLELHEELLRRGFTIPVIIMTGHGDVPMAVRAMRAGAIDFIEKPLNNQLLIERINEALRMSAVRYQHAEQARAVNARLATLSAREREVALAVAGGKQNKVIAFDLGISQKTVEIHRHNAMQKMQATSAADLARMLTEVGAIGENP